MCDDKTPPTIPAGHFERQTHRAQRDPYIKGDPLSADLREGGAIDLPEDKENPPITKRSGPLAPDPYYVIGRSYS